jgi:hypothetical protein
MLANLTLTDMETFYKVLNMGIIDLKQQKREKRPLGRMG